MARPTNKAITLKGLSYNFLQKNPIIAADVI